MNQTDTDVLCVSVNSSEIQKGLYQRRKKIDRKYLLKFLCRAAGSRLMYFNNVSWIDWPGSTLFKLFPEYPPNGAGISN